MADETHEVDDAARRPEPVSDVERAKEELTRVRKLVRDLYFGKFTPKEFAEIRSWPAQKTLTFLMDTLESLTTTHRDWAINAMRSLERLTPEEAQQLFFGEITD